MDQGAQPVTTATTTNPVAVHFRIDALRRALSAAEQCAATEPAPDGTRIDLIHIHTSGDSMLFTATNRFIAAQSAAMVAFVNAPDGVDPVPPRVLVDACDVSSAVAMLDHIADAAGDGEITIAMLAFDNGKIIVGATTNGEPWPTMTIPTVIGPWPHEAISNAFTGATTRASAVFGGGMLKLLGAIASSSELTRISLGSDGTPARVDIGDWFTAAVMPTKSGAKFANYQPTGGAQ